MISNTEKAWAAGFFEGEAWLGTRMNRSSRIFGVLAVEISQVDPEPLRWMKARWGGRVYVVNAKSVRSRPSYRWIITSVACVPFLRDILPFIVRKKMRSKIKTGLAYQAQKLNTHANRTPAYRARQQRFIERMRSPRGVLPPVERAAMAGRL